MINDSIFLPDNFKIDRQGHLFYNEQRIANGYVKVLEHLITVKSNGVEAISAKLSFAINGKENVMTYTMGEINETQFWEFSTLLLELPRKQSLELFKHHIRYQLAHVEPVKFYEIDKLGFAKVNGKRCFCFGNKLIGVENQKFCIASSINRFALEYDPVDNQRLKAGIKMYLDLNPKVCLVLMAYLTLGLSRQLFIDAGVPIKFVLYIVGHNQSFKTTLACLYFNLYNRHQDIESHLYNFTSTEAKLVQVLGEMKDTPIIFDDLNKSDSASAMRAQEQKASSLIRIAANNVRRQTMRSSYDIEGQLVFTGEYCLHNISTNNRTFLLQFSSDLFDKSKIKKLQDNADIIPQFAEDYVAWLLKNYDSKVEEIKRQYDKYLTIREEQEVYQERLNNSANILRIAFNLFYDFCEDMGWSDFSEYADTFPVHILNLMNQQIEAQNLEGEYIPDYCCELYYALRNKCQFDMPEEKPTEYYAPAIYYQEKKDLLYVSGDIASEAIYEKTGKKVNYYLIFNDLFKMGFLETDNNKAGSRTKKANNKCKKRYYVIHYSDWENYVKEMTLDSCSGF